MDGVAGMRILARVVDSGSLPWGSATPSCRTSNQVQGSIASLNRYGCSKEINKYRNYLNDRFVPILLKNSVFDADEKILAPQTN